MLGSFTIKNLHRLTVLENPSDYFKEGRKASFYSRNSKSGWCPISPYQQLTEVSVDDNKLQGMS